MPALVDSGFRRGTDIVNVLAMGAEAVSDGHIWSLGAFSQPGVERMLEILRAETPALMQQVGDLPHPRYCGMTRPGPCCRRNPSGYLG